MNNLIVILGESGTGKSTSLRNLDPDETYLINVLNKPLPFKGYKKHFNEEKLNYLESDDYSKVITYLNAIHERREDIKTIIIDDFSFMMNNEYMKRCKEAGYGKFVDMGLNMFNIFEAIKSFRSDLFCFIMCHTEKDHAGVIKPKTIGKMTQDYVGIGERVTVVLHTLAIDGEYKFLTQHHNYCYAKSPMGMFDELFIDNDLKTVIEAMKEYANE